VPDWSQGDYTSTEQGSIYIDTGRGDQAGEVIDGMIRKIQGAQAGGGFDQTTVLLLVDDWEQVGTILRTPTYHNQVMGYWFSTHPPPRGGPKPSAFLTSRLGVLKKAVKVFVVSRNDIIGKVTSFNAAQEAMLEFVFAYRSALGKDALKEFDGVLRARMNPANAPGAQHI
jgi:hypothetical protein